MTKNKQKNPKADAKQYLIVGNLLNDAIAALRMAVHPNVSWVNVSKLIQELDECKPVEEE